MTQQKDLTKFSGLQLQRNSFSNNDGQLEKAENVIIQYDDIIQKRRGYKTFFNPGFTPLSLIDFKNKLLSISATKVTRYDQDANGDYSGSVDLSGTISVADMQPYSIQSNGNCYFTTDDGVRKLENATSSVLRSGVARALDLTYQPLGSGTVNSPNTGVHKADAQIGYRVLFGRKDTNNNTVLGSPSEFAVAQNTLYDSTSVSLLSFDVTVTYNSHGLSVNDFVTIRQSNGSVPVADGDYVISSVTTNTFTFSTVAAMASAPTGVTSLKFGIRRKPQLNFSVPDDVNTTQFLYQIYRTNNTASNSVEPDESTLQLVYEANVSSSDLSNGYITYTDLVDDIFKETYLYTNPNTGEGILEANDVPPVCKDVAVFRNHAFFANIIYNNIYELNLVRASAATFTNGDYVDVINTTDTRTTTSAVWQSGTTVRYSINDTSSLATGQYALITGFANSDNNGKFIITAINTNTYIEVTSTRINGAHNETGVIGAKIYLLRRYTAGASESFNTTAGGTFLLETSGTVAINIDTTARSLCKTINRDDNGFAYCFYVSTTLSLPGQMFLQSKIPNISFALQASSSTVGENFDPILPNTFSDLSKASSQSSYSNGLAISKQNIPEAVPATSFMLVGSKDAEILRVVALRDSLIIVKQDGVFRLVGDNRSNFVVTMLDSTVICKGANSVAVLNNSVYLVSNQGVVSITDSAVAVMSRNIEPLFVAVIGNINFAANTYGVGLESDRLYMLTTLAPNTTTANVTYVYNTQTNAWTTSTKLYRQGIVLRKDDTHYSIDASSDIILKQRKQQTKLDFCDDQSTVTVLSVATNKLTAEITSGLTLQIDDIIVYQDAINYITAVSGSTITFFTPVNFPAGGVNVVHYKQIVSEFTTAPMTMGDTSRNKLFTELQLSLRGTYGTKFEVAFMTEQGRTEFYDWESALFATPGWGTQEWGVFPWGEQDVIDLEYETMPMQPIRNFIPNAAGRSTWLKVIIRHAIASEPINLQTVAVTYTTYSTRTST